MCKRPAVSTTTVSSPALPATSTASKATVLRSSFRASNRQLPPGRPRLQLLRGGRAEDVGGAEDGASVGDENSGQLSARRGLAGAIDPDHQDDRGSSVTLVCTASMVGSTKASNSWRSKGAQTPHREHPLPGCDCAADPLTGTPRHRGLR